jgi:hypothetical protein
MNTFVLLPLQESMVEHGAGKHEQWRGCMIIIVVQHEIIQSISILRAVIRLMIKFDVNKLRDDFAQEVKCMLAIR